MTAEGARLVLATRNEHKVVELRELLADVKANPKRYFKVSVF